ncbi:hypothetical protein [Arhodomonas sp. AD133]|uniref:hypothetical protein n=1 Tax=Arhodomonas sp. AD133 TaxID=3415009 RepID=UPI003EBE2217
MLGSLYVAQGLPLGFSMIALPVLLRSRGMDLAAIGQLGVLLLPWAFKFLWAPLLDRWRVPGLGARGQRAGWVLGCQLLAVPVALALATLDPVAQYGSALALLLVLNVLFATQDVAVDALAVNGMRSHGYVGANGVQTGGFSLGMVLGGCVTLPVYGAHGWPSSVLVLSALIGACLLPVFALREPRATSAAVPQASLRRFFRRPGSRQLLAAALLYKLPAMAGYALVNPLLVEQGAAFQTISVVNATCVAVVAVIGSALAVWLARSWASAQSVAVLAAMSCAVWLAFGLSLRIHGGGVVVTLIVQSLSYLLITMAAVLVYARFMAHASNEQPGTDFSILYCAEAIANMLAHMLGGKLADTLGIPLTYVVVGVAGLMAAWWLPRLLCDEVQPSMGSDTVADMYAGGPR